MVVRASNSGCIVDDGYFELGFFSPKVAWSEVVTGVVVVFLTFSSNKCWWILLAFSFLGSCTRESRATLLMKARLRQLTTPLGNFFRELGHLICVHSLS